MAGSIKTCVTDEHSHRWKDGAAYIGLAHWQGGSNKLPQSSENYALLLAPTLINHKDHF